MAGRPRYAGEPTTDDDEAIAAALADVSVPTLLVSMVHVTGDPSWIRGPLRPAGIYLNEVQGFMAPEDQAAARAKAHAALCDWRDRGCPLPPPPPPELVQEMMDDLRIPAQQRRVTLHSAMQDEVLVHADRDRLAQVLLNLLNNAIHYGKEGGSCTVRAFDIVVSFFLPANPFRFVAKAQSA